MMEIQNNNINNQNLYEGVVYSQKLNIPNVYHYGWSYIGETMHKDKRKAAFYRDTLYKYSGENINKARDFYGVDERYWEYEVLTYVCSDTVDTLKSTLEEIEAEYIAKARGLNQNLFNSNNGGKGRGKGCKNKKKKSDKASVALYQNPLSIDKCLYYTQHTVPYQDVPPYYLNMSFSI